MKSRPKWLVYLPSMIVLGLMVLVLFQRTFLGSEPNSWSLGTAVLLVVSGLLYALPIAACWFYVEYKAPGHRPSARQYFMAVCVGIFFGQCIYYFALLMLMPRLG
jgi:uncharacterized membrane-anchored protein